jgi:hypothetical protein
MSFELLLSGPFFYWLRDSLKICKKVLWKEVLSQGRAAKGRREVGEAELNAARGYAPWGGHAAPFAVLLSHSRVHPTPISPFGGVCNSAP